MNDSSGLSPERLALYEAEAARVATDDYDPVPPPDADADQTDPNEFVARWFPPGQAEPDESTEEHGPS